MTNVPRIKLVERRAIIIRASSAAILLAALLRSGQAFAQDSAAAPGPAASEPGASAPPSDANVQDSAGSQVAAKPSETFDEMYARLTNGAKPSAGKMAFDVPEIAENGNTVPFTVTADSPMTADNHVRVIHLLSTANPQAGVARFEFTPESGKAAVSSRMRLAKTQDIVALAETSNGEFWVARTKVTVTIGGCGG